MFSALLEKLIRREDLSTEEAEAAMAALNGKELGGRTLTVNEARAREERPRPHGANRPFAGNRR